MRRLVIIFVLFMSFARLNAQEELKLQSFPIQSSQEDKSMIKSLRDYIHFNFEWGYVQNVFEHHHYNLLSTIGYRIDENLSSIYTKPNAFALLGVDFMAGQKFSFALSTGFEGIFNGCSIVPIRLRINYFYKGYHKDGFYSFAGAGLGIRSGESLMRNTIGLMLNIGEGYRISLTPSSKIDFILSIRNSRVNPMLPDPDGPGFAPEENIRYNNAEFYALSFSIMLSY